MTESERIAIVQQKLEDHLNSCTRAYDRNAKAHEVIHETLKQLSHRLWALILTLITLSIGVIIRLLTV